MRTGVDVELRIRRLMLALLAFGLLAIGFELVALGHYEDTLQLVPLALNGLTLVIIGWHAVKGGRSGLALLRIAFVFLIAAGVVGIALHGQGNMEFQLDINPDLKGWPLIEKVLHAQAPPALAPGVMAQLGLLGLIYAYRHPAERTT